MDIIKESKYFSSFCFLGGLDMGIDTLLFFINHYKDTQNNLIDDYCEVIYLSWECKNNDFYLTREEFKYKQQSVSKIRRLRKFNTNLISDALYALEIGFKNLRIEELRLDEKPRRDAQKFIGDKKTRNLIFDKYGKLCLCCGTKENISLDHITPIYLKGENKIDNLQPLCRSCNSRKGTKIIDYR